MNVIFGQKKDLKNHKDVLNLKIKVFQCQVWKKQCLLKAKPQMHIPNTSNNIMTTDLKTIVIYCDVKLK